MGDTHFAKIPLVAAGGVLGNTSPCEEQFFSEGGIKCSRRIMRVRRKQFLSADWQALGATRDDLGF